MRCRGRGSRVSYSAAQCLQTTAPNPPGLLSDDGMKRTVVKKKKEKEKEDFLALNNMSGS